MKKALFIVGFILLAGYGFSALQSASSKRLASEFNVTVGKHGENVSLDKFVLLEDAEYEALRGEKMGWFGRMQFHKQQRKLSKLINSDGTIDNDIVPAPKNLDTSKGFNLTGFIMGLSLSLVGVLIMYLVKGENKANRVKWAWVGAAFWVAFLAWVLIADN